MKLSERWEKEDVSLWEVTPSNLKLEKIEPPKKNADKKTFSSAIQKYNKWHDPKTGRFTSAPGGTKATASSARQTVVIDGIEVPEIMVNRGFTDVYVANMKRKIAKDEIKSVLSSPHAVVNLGGMDADLAIETADTVKRTVEQYPMLKDAIRGIETYRDEERVFAQYDPETRKIELNLKYYENKSTLIDNTKEQIDAKWNPKGTDHNSHVVHEMGHALDFYASEILYGEERVVYGHRTVSKKIWNSDVKDAENGGRKLSGMDIRDGLSAYASSSAHEYFAEAFSEVTCSPNPRPMAKGIWEKFSVYMNEAQEKQEKGESRVGKSFSAIVQKFNPYHDPKTGRFTSATGGTASYHGRLTKEKTAILQKSDTEKTEYVFGNISGGQEFPQLKEMCVSAAKDGKADALVNDYFKLMEINGDATPTKPTAKQLTGESEHRKTPIQKKEYVKEQTGMGEEEAQKTAKELGLYFTYGTDFYGAESKRIVENFIDKAPAYDGAIYRGMKFNGTDYDKFMQNIQVGGKISMQNTSSWSSDPAVAERFSGTSRPMHSVQIVCVKNKTAVPVECITTYRGESEVLAHSKTKWTILHHETAEKGNGFKLTKIAVMEEGEQ